MFAKVCQFAFSSGKWAAGFMTGGFVTLVASIVPYLAGWRSIPVFLVMLVGAVSFAIGAFIAWERETDEVTRYKKIFSTMPHLRVEKLDCINVKYQYGDGTQPSSQIGSALILKIKNDPMFPVPEANATKVGAKLTFYDSNGSELFNLDARWAHTDQPSLRDIRQSRADLLRVDIPIGQSWDIDIAMKYPNDPDAFGYNNESYNHYHYQNLAWRLAGEHFTVDVHVQGTYIDNVWRVRFKNAVNGLVPEGFTEIRNFLNNARRPHLP